MTDRHRTASLPALGAAGLWGGYLFLVWSGIGLPGLSGNHYDLWRQVQLPTLLAFWGLAAWSLGRHQWVSAASRPTGWIPLAAATLSPLLGLALVVWARPTAPSAQRSLADLGLWLGVGATLPLLAIVLKSATGWARAAIEALAAWLALLPILATPALVFYVHDALTLHVAGSWQLAFANPRYFDNTLMPCLLLLWLRPGWLAAPRVDGLVLAVSGWYLFGLMLDGARGDLLCLAVALATATWGSGRRAWPILRTALLSAALAGLGALLVRTYGASPAIELARGGTSGRLDHWQAIVEVMRQRTPDQLATGFGGDGLLAAMAPLNHGPDATRRWISFIAHPHNLPLQWLSEWGLLGAGLCGLALLPLWWFWRRRDRLPVLSFGAVLALYLDGLLSGLWIYPQSQMAGLWLLAWLAAGGGGQGLHDPPSGGPVERVPTGTLLCFTALGLGLSLLLFVHARDLHATSGAAGDGSWPRFWLDGARLHLPDRP